MLVTVVVSADVTDDIVVLVNVSARFVITENVTASSVQSVSVSIDYPFVGMLVIIVPGASITDTVVVTVCVRASSGFGNVVAGRLAPMLVIVVRPVVVRMVAHNVFARITDTVVGCYVNVSRSV